MYYITPRVSRVPILWVSVFDFLTTERSILFMQDILLNLYTLDFITQNTKLHSKLYVCTNTQFRDSRIIGEIVQLWYPLFVTYTIKKIRQSGYGLLAAANSRLQASK
jgi:hypothetical protein